MIESLTRLNNRQPPNIKMKSIFSSVTIWGFFIALVSRFIGHEITASDGATLVSEVQTSWPLIVGVVADLTVAWKRVAATRFDVSKLASPVFWAAIVGGAMTALQGYGTDWAGLENLPEKVGLALASVGGLVGCVLQLVGRARASQPLGLVADPAASPRASIVVPSWLVVILRMIPWRILMAYVLEKWASIAPGQFEEIIKTVLAAEPKALDGGEKSMLVHDSASRNWPELKPHEREAAVALAVAGLASEGKLKLS